MILAIMVTKTNMRYLKFSFRIMSDPVKLPILDEKFCDVCIGGIAKIFQLFFKERIILLGKIGEL